MAELRSFDYNGFFYLENVLVAEQISSAGTARKVPVEEWIVIGAPVDLRDIEVSG